jgi:ABC-type polar amino acid transport system ATPase subunit
MPAGAVIFYEGTSPLDAEKALLKTVEARVDSLRGVAMGNDWVAHLLNKARTVADRVKMARLGIYHDAEAATPNVVALGSVLHSLAPEGMEYSVISDGYGYTRLSPTHLPAAA